MLNCKKLAIFVVLFAPVALLHASTKKGDKFFAQCQLAETSKHYDEALTACEQALSQDPADPGYQLATNRIRFHAGQQHIELGMKLRSSGKTAEALAQFEKAYAIDPASSIAEQEIRRTRAILEREKKTPQSELQPEDRGLTAADMARKDMQNRLDRMMPVPELKPLSSKPIDLKMNNQPPKVLFETVAKLAGLNVVFDPDIPAGGKNQSVEFNGSTVEEALDYLSTLTKSFWKPLSGNTIFVTQDNTTKRRDYEDQVVKVFYLKNVNTPQELQEIATDVRTVCDIRRLFTYNAQMALIVRAEADRVALAEKLIADLDKPKAEVVIDVLVLENNADNKRDLGFGLADGINTTIAYNGTGSTATSSTSSTTSTNSSSSTTSTSTTATTGAVAIPLNQIQHLSTGQFSVVLPNASFQATMSRTNAKVLQSPQVRAADNAKAVLKIGQKVPTASGSFQPGVGGVGINPLVNTQFQFIDVGVNVDITPKIHGTDEVSLHVDMDISNVVDHVDLGGISQPVIGQRKVTFDVRMREGEVNVLGGLIQVQDSINKTGTPGLASIPLVGRLFSRESKERSTNELIFVLIPHIVRAQEITDTNLRGVASGSDTVVKLNYAPRRALSNPPPAVPTSTAAATAAPAPAPAAPPATAPPATAPPATAPPATAPPATAPPTASGSFGVRFAPAQAETQVGAPITVSLMVDNAADLFAAPVQIKFDPTILRLNDVTAGNLMNSDGKETLPLSKNIQNDTGEASISLTRTPGTGGVKGSGTLLTFSFQALAKGASPLSVTGIPLRDPRLQLIRVTPPQMTITVK